jgi:hypothetical protein
VLLIGIYLIGIKKDRNLLPEIIIGFLIGVNWEIYSAHEWAYDSSKFIMINLGIETIPLDVIIAWSGVQAAILLIVSEMMKLLKKRSKFVFLIFGWIALFFAGLTIEFVGYYGGFWYYSVITELSLWPTSIPLRIIFGWIVLGTCNLATILFYRDYVEKKIQSFQIIIRKMIGNRLINR